MREQGEDRGAGASRHVRRAMAKVQELFDACQRDEGATVAIRGDRDAR